MSQAVSRMSNRQAPPFEVACYSFLLALCWFMYGSGVVLEQPEGESNTRLGPVNTLV